jgi:tryptophanyl-tRNA synthetase
MKRILSGVQPTGTLHLGNYFGALQQHIELQDETPGPEGAFYFIANYHALTTIQDPTHLAELTRNVALDYLALGLDPSKATFFRQSDVPEVCELTWLLGCTTGMGLLERAHSYKDKVARGIKPNVGLFAYPVLMASDILIYRSNVVPVGKDQQQHVEMAQDMAQSFNATFQREVLVRPEWRFSPGAKVPGLDGEKMSKSYDNTIPIFLPDEMTDKQAWKTYFARIVTDSKTVEDPKDPEDTLMQLYRLLAPAEAAEFQPLYVQGGIGYGELKKRLHKAYIERFGPLRDKRRELAADPDFVEGVLEEGARRARGVAREVMADAREATGLAVAAHTHAAPGSG